MPTYPTCVFCGQNDSKPSKEELLAKWVAREWPDAKWTVTRFTSGQPDLTFIAREHFGLTSRKPCRRCNSEWMGDLENKAKPILRPMIHGEQTTLSAADQLMLARWATKSAVVYDTHRKDNEYFFMSADCNALFSSNATPFVDSAIYLARYDDATVDQCLLTETREVGTPQSPDANHDLLTLEMYAATFAIKHLALQVFILRRHKELRKAGPVIVGLQDSWSDRTINIWPTGGSVTWPPRLALDKISFTSFAKRWLSPNIGVRP